MKSNKIAIAKGQFQWKSFHIKAEASLQQNGIQLKWNRDFSNL